MNWGITRKQPQIYVGLRLSKANRSILYTRFLDPGTSNNFVQNRFYYARWEALNHVQQFLRAEESRSQFSCIFEGVSVPGTRGMSDGKLRPAIEPMAIYEETESSSTSSKQLRQGVNGSPRRYTRHSNAQRAEPGGQIHARTFRKAQPGWKRQVEAWVPLCYAACQQRSPNSCRS